MANSTQSLQEAPWEGIGPAQDSIPQEPQAKSEPSASSADNNAILQMLQSMQSKMDTMHSGMENMKQEVNNMKNNQKEEFELSDCQPVDGKKTDISVASLAAREVHTFSW